MTMEEVNVDVEYLSAGANRQTAAGDWNIDGTVAFGADTSIALWKPTVRDAGLVQAPPIITDTPHVRTPRREASAHC